MYLYIELGGYMPILGAHSIQYCSTLSRYLLPTVYLCMVDIANPDLLVCCCQTWICLDITLFYEELSQSYSMAGMP